MTITCQLKRFALGGDVEGVDAHASFPMMAVRVPPERLALSEFQLSSQI
jgi:hypothetical protein